eukprot:tig00020629_g12395.t1
MRADGQRIVSGSRDKSVRVWDAETGAELLQLQATRRERGDVGTWRRGADSTGRGGGAQDGRRIVSGSRDNSVRVWDAETGAELLQLQGHTDYVRSVAVSADAVVGCSDSGRVLAWALPSGEPIDPASLPAEGGPTLKLEPPQNPRVPFAVCALPGGGSLLAAAGPARGLSVERVPPFRCTRRIARTAALEARGARVDAGTGLEPRLRRLLLQLGAVEAGGAAAPDAAAGPEEGEPLGQQR